MRYYSVGFYFLLRITFVVASTDSLDSPDGSESQFCQWEIFYVSSVEMCNTTCASAKGLHHPISNELICFKEKSVAKPFFVPKYDLGFHNCYCVASNLSDFVECNPVISSEKHSSRHCHHTCQQYTVYKYVKNNKNHAFCEESSKVKELSLDFLISRERLFYTCKCGLKLKELLKRENIKRGRRKIGLTIIPKFNAEFLLECPIESSLLPNTNAMDYLCSENCSAYMGYITDDEKLLCFNRIDSAVDISLKNDSCTCGFVKRRFRKSDLQKHRQKCDPDIIFPSIVDREQCQNICSTYTVLRKYHKKKLDTLWCGKIWNPNRVFLSMDWSTSKNSDRKKDSTYHCSCGLETLNKETLLSSITQSHPQNLSLPVAIQFGNILTTDEHIIFHLDGKQYTKRRIGFAEKTNEFRGELEKTCKMEPIDYAQTSRCLSSCLDAKAFFIHSNYTFELICYHFENITEDIFSTEDNTCECGLRLNRDTLLSCNPRTIHSTSNKVECSYKCANTKAYIFDPYSSLPMRITLCSEKDYTPDQIVEELDSKIGNYVKNASKKGSGAYSCECGVRAYSQRNYDTVWTRNSSGAGTSQAPLRDDNRSNDDIFEHLLEDDSFIDSLKYPPADNVPDIELFETTNENIDSLSRVDPNLPSRDNHPISSANESSHLPSRSELLDPSILIMESIEAYLMNDDDNIPVDDLSIPSVFLKYAMEFYRESQSSLNAQTNNSLGNIEENTSLSRTDYTQAFFQDNNDNESNDALRNALTAKNHSTHQSSFPSEYESIESFLMNDDFSRPARDYILPSRFAGQKMRSHGSSVIFDIGSTSDTYNSEFRGDSLQKSISPTNSPHYQYSLPAEYESIEPLLTNTDFLQPVGDFNLPSNIYEEEMRIHESPLNLETGLNYPLSSNQNEKLSYSTDNTDHEMQPSKKRSRKS